MLAKPEAMERLRTMIVSGGENIYPAEVENALSAHRDITGVAVLGAPDVKYRSVVIAIYVPCEPTNPPNTDTLVEFCRSRMAGYKIPRRYEFTNELPRNASGKFLKTELCSRYG